MKSVAEWIRRHPVLSFFLFTFAITWPAVIIYYAFPGNPALELLLLLAAFSPALVAMLISSIEEPQPKSRSSRPRWIVFIVSWLISAMILTLYSWKIQTADFVAAIVTGSILALLPAWLFSSANARTPGIRKQFSTLLRPRGPALWYLIVFLVFPGIPLLGMGITRLFGGEAHFRLADMSFGDAAVILILEFLHNFLLTGGINEECGWRGFALPRLQARYPVIVSAGILWIFWAAWHLPHDIGRGDSLAGILVTRLFLNLLVTILMVWLYNRTNGSILAPALFHAAMNAFGDQFQMNAAQAALQVLLVVFAIVYDRMWKRLPDGTRAAFRTIKEVT